MASPLRTAILATRGFATFFAAAGLTLYAIIMVNLTRSDYPPMLQGLTALPLAGVSPIPFSTSLLTILSLY